MQKAAVARMSISVPAPEVYALHETCMDLKQAVEQMQGRYDEDGTGYRARMTVQPDPPIAERDGEFWLTEGASNVLSVAYKGKWYRLGALVP